MPAHLPNRRRVSHTSARARAQSCVHQGARRLRAAVGLPGTRCAAEYATGNTSPAAFSKVRSRNASATSAGMRGRSASKGATRADASVHASTARASQRGWRQ